MRGQEANTGKGTQEAIEWERTMFGGRWRDGGPTDEMPAISGYGLLKEGDFSQVNFSQRPPKVNMFVKYQGNSEKFMAGRRNEGAFRA